MATERVKPIVITKRVGVIGFTFTLGCAIDPPDPTSVQVDTVDRGTFTLRGSGTLFGVTTDGLASRPIDLSTAQLSSYALVDGSFVRNDGEGTAEGTFTVPVERGARTWYFDANLSGLPVVAVGNARHPSLDLHQLGRLDPGRPTVSTPVTFEVTGLEPWIAGDTTELTVGNNGTVLFSPEFSLATLPAPGDTVIVDQTLDWQQQFGAFLVDAAQGDVATLTQLVLRTSGTESYQAVAAAGDATAFTQTDGGASTMTVAMAPVAQSSHAVGWRGSEFAALRAEVGPNATEIPGFQGLFIDALPDASRFGFYANAPDLAIYIPSDPTTDHDVTMSYGNPYRARHRAWDVFAVSVYQFAVPVALPGAAPRNIQAGYQSNRSLHQLHGVATPRISPVRHVRIDGRPLDAPLAGVGTTPVVCWDEPALGEPNQYAVTIQQLGVSSGRTTATTVAQIVTTERELRIPNDFLAEGSTYILRIVAIDFGDVDRTKDLFGDGLPFESASMVTSTFAP